MPELPDEAPPPPRINLIIDIQERLQNGKGPGFERWAKVYNLKQMAAALQFLQEYKLTDYTQLAARTEIAVDRFHRLGEELQQTEAALSKTAELMSVTVNYAKARPVFDGYKASRYSKKYLAEHEAELATYRAATAAMGTNTDFVAAFSNVGKAVSGGKVGEALNDAYVAVFGPSDENKSTDGTAEKTAAATDGTTGTGAASVPVVYSADNLPARVCLEQQVLGFSYQAPVEGVLTSEFGLRAAPSNGQEKFHYGVDLGVDDGTVIHCFADGTVTVVGDSSELGKYIMVQHNNGFVSLYGHCSKIMASSGQTVREGDPIAEVGHTGNATGPHLHFELHHDAVYLNPVYYV